MGGPGATVSSDDGVAAMLKVIGRLKPSNTGHFLDRRWKEMPWGIP